MPIFGEDERAIEESTRKAMSAQARTVDGFLGADAGWTEVSEQGWPLILVDEDSGGFGLSMRHAVVVVRELGRAGCTWPVGPTLAAARVLARHALDLDLTQQLLEGGGPLVAAALASDGPSFAPRSETTLGYLIPDQATQDGLRLVDAPDSAPPTGVTLLDGSEAVWLDLIASHEGHALPQGSALMRQTLGLLVAAECLGIAEDVLDRSVDYLKVRNQFGQPIGKFQVLQHRAADMYAKVQALQALVFEAATADSGPRGEFASRAALALARRSVISLCNDAIQLHGAIGYTDECVIGHRLRRAIVLLSTP